MCVTGPNVRVVLAPHEIEIEAVGEAKSGEQRLFELGLARESSMFRDRTLSVMKATNVLLGGGDVLPSTSVASGMGAAPESDPLSVLPVFEVVP